MADFVAVLKKTIDGLGDATPEIRSKVYDKARATIEAKLAAMSPPPPATLVDRQKKALENAIVAVEAEYAPPPPPPAPKEEDDKDPLGDLESIFSKFSDPKPKTVAAAPLPAALAAKPALTDEVIPSGLTGAGEPAPDPADEPPLARPASVGRARKSRRGLVAAVIALIVVAGAGYGAWLNRAEIGTALGVDLPAMVANWMPGSATKIAERTPPAKPARKSPEKDATAKPAKPAAPAGESKPAVPANETKPTAPATEKAAAPAAGNAAGQAANEEPLQKFTQRLGPDGTETDPGPAGGEPKIGEGTSVAAASTPPAAPAPATPPAAGQAAPAAAPSSGEDEQVPVAQRAIFYEEKTSSAEGSAAPGSIVWSLVQESPGGDLPPEPAIRAEATIPGKDVQLRMTIRRNGDKTLPASHIIELIFLTPDKFEGGGIESVLRVAMKDSEQAPGTALMGIPAKIADGFFLLALNDGKAAVEANTNLMRNEDWLDIPIVYKSGRRALITMEKGIPGEKVFEDALKAWQTESSG